jgi:hypothetical protein
MLSSHRNPGQGVAKSQEALDMEIMGNYFDFIRKMPIKDKQKYGCLIFLDKGTFKDKITDLGLSNCPNRHRTGHLWRKNT